jgi:hypothetical protein
LALIAEPRANCRVHVDPAGRNQEATSLNLAPSRSLLPTDSGDPTFGDCNIARKWGLAGSIDDGAAANDDVVHWIRS